MKEIYTHPTLKLGKRAPINDPRTFKLAKYLRSEQLPTPKPAIGYLTKVPRWNMYLNDIYGCCVVSAMGHHVDQWCAYTGRKSGITNRDIQQAYSDIGGFVPGEPWTDNGCNMLTALNYWRNTGLAGHKIAAFASVDWINHLEMMQAMQLFGALFVGVALPLTSQNDPVWEVPKRGPIGNGSPGTWGGHCIVQGGYRGISPNKGSKVVTWGGLTSMTWNYVDAYMDEAYAVLSEDWFDQATKKAPSGFDIDQLKADLESLS